MVRWLGILVGTLRSCLRTHRDLALENLALRQQLAVWKAREPRPRLTEMDRIFWVFLSKLWTSWRHSLLVVRPETVVGWSPAGVSALLGVEESAPIRSAHDQYRAPRSDSGSRPSLWRAIFAPGQGIGHPRSGNCAPLALAKRVRRAGDWLDSSGMPRPRSRDRRAASSPDPVEVRRLLQRDADTLVIG